MLSANEFLKYFPDYVIQTFDDREYVVEKDPSLITVGPPRLYSEERLRDLNTRGAGIFFTVNKFPTGKRAKDLCAGINAWYSECDSLSIVEQVERYNQSPLPPTFLVMSKKSIHAYWLAVDGTEKNFVRIQQGLIKHFQGDPAMKDISRVLRIPGFFHNKTKEPFLVNVVSAQARLRYTEKQMLAAFPWTEPVKTAAALFDSKPMRPVGVVDDFWVALSSIPNKIALARMSGQPIVNGEIFTFRKRSTGGEYIDVNGSAADAWIDENGMIGSGKGGGPIWISWLTYYGRSKAEVAKWARLALVDLIPEKILNNKSPSAVAAEGVKINNYDDLPSEVTYAPQHLESVTAIYKSPPSPFTWGTLGTDRGMPVIESGHYVVLFGDSGSGKTTFAFHMARENAKKISNIVFVSLEMSKDQLLNRYARDRAGVDKEHYRKREFDDKIAEIYFPEVANLGLVGIDKGDQYSVPRLGKLIEQYSVNMLFVDNLNKIKGEGHNELELTQNVSQGILNLTRKYHIPIILIHHANKPTADKSKKKKEEAMEIKARGMSGLRGTQKTADDADIIVEISRAPEDPSGCPIEMGDDIKRNSTAMMSTFKDREFGTRSKQDVYYRRGNYYDDWGLIAAAEKQFAKEDKEILDIARDFGGEVVV
jgi:energy-coupling factor transporter ATP-binding protein EcfA2